MSDLTSKNGIVTIGFFSDAVIVLKNIATITIEYNPSMFSDGTYHLLINGVSVARNSDKKRLEAIKSDLIDELRKFWGEK